MGIVSVGKVPISLETPIGEDGDAELGDLISDRNSVPVEEIAANSARRDQVDRLLENLNDREQRIVSLRFGLVDGNTHTLEEIGTELGLTRERIRQIESNALTRLRQLPETRYLHEFLR